jgi:hypothetical protein
VDTTKGTDKSSVPFVRIYASPDRDIESSFG